MIMDPCKELQRLLLSGRGFAVDYANPTKNALLITAKDSPAWTNTQIVRAHGWLERNYPEFYGRSHAPKPTARGMRSRSP